MSSARDSAVLRHIRKLAAVRTDHELPDHQLLGRFAARQDEAAFAVLLERHGAMVLSVCRSVLHDLHDAEDAFQAAFLLLAQKAGSIYRREAVSSWLYRVAYHLAVRARADLARRRDLEKRAVTMPAADPVLDLSLREVRTLLLEELEGLPEPYRAPLVLCGLEEKSLEEAARLLGQSKGAVKGRLQRGRALLRARLSRRGLELPAALFATALGLPSASGQVSAALAGSTLRAAVTVAAGGDASAGLVSAEVAALVEEASMTLAFSKARIATVLLLAVSVAVTAFGALWHHAPGADRPGQAEKPKPQEKQPPPAGQTRPDADRTIEVRGRVLGPDGKPVAGAKLYLAPPTSGGPAPSQQATSGPDGRFRFAISKAERDEGDEERPVQVLAVAEGHGCDWAKVGPAGQELTLRLVKDMPIVGRILDPDGKPVAGARLRVTALWAAKGEDLGGYLEAARKRERGYAFAKYWSGPLSGQPAVFTTGSDGRFRLSGAGRERIVGFHLEGPGIASTSLEVMTRAAESVKNPNGWGHTHGASFDHVGHASRPIRGVVRDKETGKPIAGVSVGGRGSWLQAVTDKEGRYELLGKAKSPDYWLTAEPSDGLYFQRQIKLQDTPGLGPLSCDIELVRGLMVRGRVTDGATGKPIAGAKVDYHPLGGNSYVDKLLPGSWDPRAEAVTDPDGSYALTVMPGPGVMGVTAPRWKAYMPAAVTLAERKAFFKTPLVDDTDEDSFTRYAGGGSYGSIGVNYNALVLLEPGEKEKALVRDMALSRPLERKGKVVGPDGQPLVGVKVYGLVRFGIETLKGNEFTVRGINPRANRPLVFYHKEKNLGFFVKNLRGEPPGPLVVNLQPCGSASGRVVDQDGQPVAGLRIDVWGQALRITGEEGGGYQVVTTDKAGRFRAEGLVPGQEYVVWEPADNPGHPRVHATVVVESGKHKEMGDIKRSERVE